MKEIVLPHRIVEALIGTYDENLKLLESLFDVRIHARGSHLVIDGEKGDVATLERILADFSGLVEKGQVFSRDEFQSAVTQIAQDAALSLQDFFPRLQVSTGKRTVIPKSKNQRRYLESIQQHDIVFAIGPGGTGKTFLAVAMALYYLNEKAITRIILTRPAVEAGEKLGFLPGDMQEKVNPYLRPLYDALYHLADGERVLKLMERGTIEIAPLAFMRGRTLSDAFIILDEAQNTTSEQMKMFLTRIGPGSKAVITGDITQIDLPPGRVSGLVEARAVLERIPGPRFCYFDEGDVVRHELVRLIIRAYEDYSSQNGSNRRGTA
ncbi:MAG: PhoH family protein [Acidobacteria bacterium]|nr:PhoH family protein [Acidobacteriota bacterium]